ncbi:MAG: bifunctional enoyl-CoA hydratase/phosphate acetyltransferase [Sphingomonadales bacterium]
MSDDEIRNLVFDDLAVDDEAALEHRLEDRDIRLFAAFVGDIDPENMDRAFASDTAFSDFAGSGQWALGLLQCLIIARLPGPGTKLVKQHLAFGPPLEVGTQIRARIRVAEKNADTGTIALDCRVEDTAGACHIKGRIFVQAPEQPYRHRRGKLPSVKPSAQPDRFARLVEQAQSGPPVRMAVVQPIDAASLEGALASADAGLIDPVLVGPRERITNAAKGLGRGIERYQCIDAQDAAAAAKHAAQLAAEGQVDALMKGALHTDSLMEAVFGLKALRGPRRVSHVFAMDVPAYERLLFISDAAINIRPNLAELRDIVQNAIDLAHALGIEEPRVALLSAVETVTEKLESTVNAAALCKMADRGAITGAVLDGPLAFDNAVSKQAAQIKGLRSAVAGQADILIVPDLVSGNILAKDLDYLAGAEAAGIVLGAKVPIALTSRADSVIERRASAAIAAILAHRQAARDD